MRMAGSTLFMAKKKIMNEFDNRLKVTNKKKKEFLLCKRD
jgi:hypothetical protein